MTKPDRLVEIDIMEESSDTMDDIDISSAILNNDENAEKIYNSFEFLYNDSHDEKQFIPKH